MIDGGLDASGKNIEHGGERWFLFGVEYLHDGKRFEVEIWARSFAEARRMVASLRSTAGEPMQITQQWDCDVPPAFVAFIESMVM